MRISHLLVASALAVSTLSSPASAAVLLGESVGIQYFFPSITQIFQDLGTNLVGTDASTSFASYFDFSFTDTTVTTSNFGFDSSWTTTDFNGFRIYDVNSTIADITSVTINSASNMVGLDASRITFDADNIYVNWNGLAFNTGTVVTLDINAAAVPEPATWALMLTGFGLIGGAMRRRNNAVVA